MGVILLTLVLSAIIRFGTSSKAFREWFKCPPTATMDYMNLRLAPAVLLTLCWGQAAFANTSYSFGTTDPFDMYNGTTTSPAGVWNETIAPGATSQSIVCINALANTSKVCGNPGPDDSVSISIPAEPGNSTILPAGTTNYLIIDGDDTYGAPVSTDMTGLIVGATYQVTFYQATSEETGNDQADNDSWQVYVLPGLTSGVYICPTCATPVNPDPADLAFTTPAVQNTGGESTPWQQENFTFTATNVTELLEFVTDAVAAAGGAVEPPFLALAGVSSAQVTPEPGTWVLTILGAGLVFAGSKLRRRRPSQEYKRVTEAHVDTKT